MANSNKDIVITPNRNSSTADPKIIFSGADATTSAQNISLNVYPTSNGTLSFEGSSGQLFSITNSLSGTIFSVNDVSGIPSIEVLDTGNIKLAQYSGNTGIGVSSPTAKLHVGGDAIFTGAITQTVDSSTTYGPNTTWSSYLRVGGNGRTVSGTNYASVVTTNGNLHLDSGSDKTLYLNYYSGTGGIYFGNGASSSVGSITSAGVFSVSGTVSGSNITAAGNVIGNAATATTATNLSGFTNTNSLNPISGADSLTNNGIGYVTSISLFGQTDGALYGQGYSASWVHQIYGDYRTGQIAIRGKNSGTWQSWRTVLDSSNYSSYASPLAGSTSLTTTGTVTSGTWSGSFGAVSGANLTSLTAGNLSGTIPSAVLGNSTHYIGTTAIALNRASASQSLTGVSIDGQAVYLQSPDGTRDASTRLPNTNTRNVRFDFCSSTSSGTGGNYAGVMTYAPWDGTTASTGDASYQLAFGSTATNGSGIPKLNIRNGIDSTWNSWYTLLHSGNYTSYVGSGTFGVSIGVAGATNTTVTWGTSSGFNANSTSNYTYDLKVGPALTNLATLMTTAGAGFIKRGATADTYSIDTNTYLTGNQSITLTGDVTGSGATSIATTLANSGVTAGSYTTANITVDAKGRVTAASSGSGGTTITNDTTTNSSFYPVFTTTTSGSMTAASVSNTKMYFNPSTGTLSATVFNSLSDINLKKNIVPIINSLDIINQIDAVEYDWKDNDKHSSGVIAQQLETILPYLVETNDRGEKSVNYSGLIAFLIGAIKDLYQLNSEKK